jgi:hypothetical protein
LSGRTATYYAAVEWTYKISGTEGMTLLITLDNPVDNLRSDQNGPRESHLNYELHAGKIQSWNHDYLKGHIIIDRFKTYAMLPSKDLAETHNKGNKGTTLKEVPFGFENNIIDLMKLNPVGNIDMHLTVDQSHFFYLKKK